MAKARTMTRNQNHDDHDASLSSNTKRFKTFDKGDVACWSDVNQDVLFLVIMQLGVIDFLAFSGVCKSWRSLALSDKNMFMASKPPMSIFLKAYKEGWWYLEDYEKRMFKTIIPHSANRTCLGITCGYLILYGRETRDFWLVNPITRQELHFPQLPLSVGVGDVSIKAVLVFSPSISGWVFVVLHRIISFYIAGKRGWNHVSSTLPISDLLYFKGKIYTRHIGFGCNLGELRLYPNRKRKWTLHEPKNLPKPDFSYPELVSSGENLYAIYTQTNKVMELDLGEMKWVSPEKTIGEYAFFLSDRKSSAAIKPQSLIGLQTQYKSYDYFLDTDESR